MLIEILASSSSGQIFNMQSADSVVVWGAEEYNIENFIRVRVTDTTIENVEIAARPWRRWTTYDVLFFDPMRDLFEVKMYARFDTVSHVTGEGGLTLDEVRTFLLDWGAVILPDSETDHILFRLTALDALNGKGFIYFGDQDDAVIFTETSYDPVPGTHVISMSYSQSTLDWPELQQYLQGKNITILSHDEDTKTLIFSVTRNQLILTLEDSVRQRFNIEVGGSRHCVRPEIIQMAKETGVVTGDWDTIFFDKLEA